jgi:hypothetical protein
VSRGGVEVGEAQQLTKLGISGGGVFVNEQNRVYKQTGVSYPTERSPDAFGHGFEKPQPRMGIGRIKLLHPPPQLSPDARSTSIDRSPLATHPRADAQLPWLISGNQSARGSTALHSL